MRSLSITMSLVALLSVPALAQTPPPNPPNPPSQPQDSQGTRDRDSNKQKDQNQATKLNREDKQVIDQSVSVLNSMTSGSTDKAIPHDLLSRADCVLIFPSVAKGGMSGSSSGTMGSTGGTSSGTSSGPGSSGGMTSTGATGSTAKAGQGVASCRQSNGQMGPVAFYTASNLGGQAGATQQSGDLVLLVMDDSIKNNLVEEKTFTLGQETGSRGSTGSQGTTGRSGTVDPDAKIVTWSRTQGVMSGAAFDGAVIKPNKDANQRLYGKDADGKDILVSGNVDVPAPATPLVNSIRQHFGEGTTDQNRENREQPRD